MEEKRKKMDDRKNKRQITENRLKGKKKMNRNERKIKKEKR